MGDHTETIEIDFDPEVISYEDLSNIYWNSHNSCHKPYSRQYMSIVFYHNEKQRKIADEMKKSIEEKYKEKSYTEIVPYTNFYMAENYHQKYYLQLIKPLMNDFNEIYPEFKDFINSTSAARINGYIKGYGGIEALREDIDGFGLSEKGRRALIDIVEGYGI